MKFIRNLSIKKSLLLVYSSIIILSFSVACSFFYFYSKKIIENNITQNLHNTTETILNMVEAATDASVKNRLRGIADKNYDITQSFYNHYKNNQLTEKEAKKRVIDILLSQKIGLTGYIYVIDSQGNVITHPKMEGLENIFEFKFIKEQVKLKKGYIEYIWANPGEKDKKPKALYMTYFKPWDWIISVSSYRDEFTRLIKTEDFREKILSLKFGESGYSYVIKPNGDLVIHPRLEGDNILHEKDANGREFIKELCELKNGKIIYPWKNPGEKEAREKLVIFNYIEEFDWIVASSSYLNEFYSPLNKMLIVSASTFILSLIVLFIITIYLARAFTKPVDLLINALKTGLDEDFSVKLEAEDSIFKEIKELTEYFNYFMYRIKKYRDDLFTSRDEYKSIIEGAVEGIFRSDAKGRLLKASPALASIHGYEDPKDMIKSVSSISEDLYVDDKKRDEFITTISRSKRVEGFEAEFYKKDGSKIWARLNARGVTDHNDKLLYIEGFITDITEKKLNEIELEKAKLNLEKRVDERTIELTRTINELERRTREQNILQQMNEMLQVSRNIDESCRVIPYFIGELFPGTSGVLYLKNDLDNVFVSCASWGDMAGCDENILDSDCWAIRRGKIYIAEIKGDKARCMHVRDTKNENYICNVIIAEGDVIGLFHIEFNDKNEILKKRIIRLVSEFCDNIGLVIANLKLREALHLKSLHDPLTGLYNRRYLDDYLKREISRNKRKTSSIGLLMIDIDHFKSFNDNYGHELGDRVLVKLSKILQEIIRKEDVACRYGGEEFVIVISDTDQDSVEKRSEEIRQNIESNLKIKENDKLISTTVSIGASTMPENGENYEKALKAADQALYIAKNRGRNNVVCAWL